MQCDEVKQGETPWWKFIMCLGEHHGYNCDIDAP